MSGSRLARHSTRSSRFVEEGGTLVRFAGPRLANADDGLLPVRLRRNGRVLGGAMSWEEPKALAEFDATSPFFGLPASKDVTVQRQVLAEPDPGLADKTWARLSDGTPLVTAERRGKGLIVLFHVNADANWSNLADLRSFRRHAETDQRHGWRVGALGRANGPAWSPIRRLSRRCAFSTDSACSARRGLSAQSIPPRLRRARERRTSARALRLGGGFRRGADACAPTTRSARSISPAPD